jgi:hypothetical protein
VHIRTRFRGVFEALRTEFNPMTLVSVAALVMSLAFLCIGHHQLFLLHDDGAQFEFFLPPLVLMGLYAWGYSALVDRQRDFQPGLISARMVMRTITTLVSLSFAAAGYEVFGQSWADPTSGYLSFAGVLLSMLVFAVIYGQYATTVSADMLSTAHSAGQKRKGSGRRTLWWLTILTMADSSFLIYSATTAPMTSDGFILFTLAAFVGAFCLCFTFLLQFSKIVPLATDRGVKPQ